MAHGVIDIQPGVPIRPAFLNEQHGWTLIMAYDDRAVSGGNPFRDGKDIPRLGIVSLNR